MIKKFLSKALYSMLPFLNVLIATIPFGYSLFYDKQFSPEKICLFAAVFIITTIVNIFSHYNGKIERGQNDLSVEILISERDITKSRYDMIFETFKKEVVTSKKTYHLNYNPNQKIASIIESLSKCFEKFLNIKSSYVSVSVFYHFDFHDSDKWNRVDKDYFPAFETNDAVIFEQGSFGKFLIEGTEDFYLINDKFKDGYKKNRYKLNIKDEESRKKCHSYGSIMGTKIVVKINDKEYICAILTLSTYGKKIDNVPLKLFRQKLEDKIEKYILPLFAVNIESELMQLYLQEKAKYSN